MTAEPQLRRFRALGTTADVVVDTGPEGPAAADLALELVRAELAAVDAACSRFRDDSELCAVVAAAGRPTAVSPLLAEALAVALDAAEATDGLVDPTVAGALRAWGYDRDFRSVPPHLPALDVHLAAVPGWRSVQLDRELRTVTVPVGVELDLGATAKGWAADRAAAAAALAVARPVLVSLGGDLAVAGPPRPGGWDVRITDDHAAGPHADGPVVTIGSGALATSSTTVRRWHPGAAVAHHVIDPRTGAPAATCWRTVSVAAATCAGANAAATAALVLGVEGPAWLAARDLPARLVADDGTVVTVAGWPADEEEAA